MSDKFECPNCGNEHSVSDLELWELYDNDGKETEFDCTKCDSPLIITSHVTDWYFDVEVND